MRTALITGITGQDGSYLAEFLLEKGYRVVGMMRRTTVPNFERIGHLRDKIEICEGDLTDITTLVRILGTFQPDEVYNLGAQSFVPASFEQPLLTTQVTGFGVTNMLEAIRLVNDKIRFYQASSSEMFGKVAESPQRETTPFHPRSPYGVAKTYGHWMTVNYRESYDIYACSGILFNHESPRRGPEFVTRKITRAAARIKLGLDDKVHIGNLDAKRDWGYAGDYVRAMWLMLQQEEAKDYVISTGRCHSIRDLLAAAFSAVGLDWEDHAVQDRRFLRPAEVDLLCGDSSEAKEHLGWEPEVSFEDLIAMMVKSDLATEQRLIEEAKLGKTKSESDLVPIPAGVPSPPLDKTVV